MELEEAIEIMKKFIKDTPKLPYDCIANQEIEAVQTLLNHITKQETMIQKLKKTMENDALSYVETQFVLDLIEESE